MKTATGPCPVEDDGGDDNRSRLRVVAGSRRGMAEPARLTLDSPAAIRHFQRRSPVARPRHGLYPQGSPAVRKREFRTTIA
jgi:hypothetical protein